jgi:hypothetical protein
MKQDDTSILPAIKKKLNILKNDAFSWPKTEVSTGCFLYLPFDSRSLPHGTQTAGAAADHP